MSRTNQQQSLPATPELRPELLAEKTRAADAGKERWRRRYRSYFQTLPDPTTLHWSDGIVARICRLHERRR
jgi:hypothetical protein